MLPKPTYSFMKLTINADIRCTQNPGKNTNKVEHCIRTDFFGVKIWNFQCDRFTFNSCRVG